MRKRADQEPEAPLNEKYEDRLRRWTPLFEQYAKPTEKAELARITSREDRYLYIRRVVVSDFEDLALKSGQGDLLARVLSFLPEDLIRVACQVSTIVRDVCEHFKLKERFSAGKAFLDGVRINTARSVLSVGLGHNFLILVTDDGNAYEKSVLNVPLQLVPAVASFESVVCGTFHCLLITRGGIDVYGYKDNEYGQLGIGPTPHNVVVSPPQRIIIQERIRKVSCGGNTSAVLTETGNLYTFGYGYQYNLGNHSHLIVKQYYPQLVTIDVAVLDVSISRTCTIVLTEQRLVLQYGFFSSLRHDPKDGELFHFDMNGVIKNIYCLDDGVAYRDQIGTVYRIGGNAERIASDVQQFSAKSNSWLTQDGKLFLTPYQPLDLPLPVSTFDAFGLHYAYVLSGADIPTINAQCVQCGSTAEHFETQTYRAYCGNAECLAKRARDEGATPPPPQQRQRQDERDELQYGALAILQNPRRLQDFASQVSRDEIVRISQTQDGSLYGQLNGSNMFWYEISKRFINVGFNRLVNYKEIAGKLV